MKNPLTPEQIVSVCEEIKHLIDYWGPGEIEPREIRAGSASLRRLLVHNELQKVWNFFVEDQKFIVPAPLLVIDHPEQLKLIELYTCSEVRQKNMTISTVMASRGKTMMVPTGDGKFRDETVRGAHIERTNLSLGQFIESVCIIAEGKPITRNWVVQYVANSLGGAHFGERSKKGPAFDNAMAKLKQFDVGEMPASVQELLGIGQALCKADSTKVLMEAYSGWKSKNPNVRIA